MASTEKFTNGLNKWQSTDKPMREDFNRDNEVLDSGVLWKAQYDPDGSVAKAGGIKAYVGNNSADMALYVSTTGNDSTNNGSQNAPFRTINRAVTALPKLLMSNATIIVAPGIYDELVILHGFITSGTLTLRGAASDIEVDNYVVQGINIQHCKGFIEIIGFTATTVAEGHSSFYAGDCAATTQFSSCKTVTAGTHVSSYGFMSDCHSNVFCWKCVCHNKGFGFVTSSGSKLTAAACTGTGNTNLFSAHTGGQFFYGGENSFPGQNGICHSGGMAVFNGTVMAG